MDIALARQVASWFAALTILLAYGGHRMGWMDSRSPLYNIRNATGSAVLGYVALHPFQIGFVLLEAAWVLIGLYVLLRPKKVVERRWLTVEPLVASVFIEQLIIRSSRRRFESQIILLISR